MGMIEKEPAAAGVTELMIRPRLLVEAARHGARLRLDRRGAVPGAADLARLTEAERLQETLRRQRSPHYRPARHVAALAGLFAARARAAGAHAAGDLAAGDQTKASGSSAFLRLM